MILGFSTQLNGKPTYFVERILKGISKYHFKNKELYIDLSEYYKHIIPYNVRKCHLKPKLHTIREDKNDRWQTGTKIDFFVNCRQPTMFRFAPVLPVVSTQKIYITYTKSKKTMVFIDDVCFYMQNLSLEGNHKMLHLAQNDGFDTIQDFFAYFNEDFKGKIIHWTELKY
jgi:hypothetical protein